MMAQKISSRDLIRSAGIVIVRKVDNQYLFLLLRSYNFWDSAKGRQEPGEDILMTAVRETFEETTITAAELDFKWGYDSYTTEPYKKGTKTGTYFLAETIRKTIELPISPELGKPEHEEYRWLNYDEAKKKTNKRIGKVLDWAQNKIQNKK